VSGSTDGTVRVWDAISGYQSLRALRGHDGEVMSVAFCPDGKRIVSGSQDATIRVWALCDRREEAAESSAWGGHKDMVTAVAFSPDGTRIVSGSIDTTLQVWDAMSGAEVLPVLQGHTA